MRDFVKVAIGTLKVDVANPIINAKQIVESLKNVKKGTSHVVYQELALTGYSCGDLFFQSELLRRSNEGIKYILDNNEYEGIVIFGAPITVCGVLINAAFVVQKNEILGIVPKYYLPNNYEFMEKRYFNSGFDVEQVKELTLFNKNIPFGNLLFKDETNDLIFGVEICEDVWAPISPSSYMSINGCELVFNLSASPELVGKEIVRRNMVVNQSMKNVIGYVYASTGSGESSGECVFATHNIFAECGKLLTESLDTTTDFVYSDIDVSRIRFERRNASSLRSALFRHNSIYKTINYKTNEVSFDLESGFNKTPFELSVNDMEKVLDLNIKALATRLTHINCKRVVLGLSGGLDSTYALLVAVETYKRLGYNPEDIICITMPSFATSGRTYTNAHKLMDFFKVTKREINIKNLTNEYLESINHDAKDVVFENTQARIRTSLLMNVANKENAIVIGTADLSEIALGFSTYNADNMSMYGINAGLPKSVIRQMTTYYANNSEIGEVLHDIVSTPISPELLEEQETENIIGSYEINDFIMYRFLSCGDDFARIEYLVEQLFGAENKMYVSKFFNRFFASQFKRAIMPEGAKIFNISLSSTYDFRMPSDIRMK